MNCRGVAVAVPVGVGVGFPVVLVVLVLMYVVPLVLTGGSDIPSPAASAGLNGGTSAYVVGIAGGGAVELPLSGGSIGHSDGVASVGSGSVSIGHSDGGATVGVGSLSIGHSDGGATVGEAMVTVLSETALGKG